MYEKITASIQESKVHLIIRCVVWPIKYSKSYIRLFLTLWLCASLHPCMWCGYLS